MSEEPNEGLYSLLDLHTNWNGYPQFRGRVRHYNPLGVYFSVRDRAESDLEKRMVSFFFRKVCAEVAYSDNTIGQPIGSPPSNYVAGRSVRSISAPLFFRLGIRDRRPVLEVIYVGIGSPEERDAWMIEASGQGWRTYLHNSRTWRARRALDAQCRCIDRVLATEIFRRGRYKFACAMSPIQPLPSHPSSALTCGWRQSSG